MKGENLSVQASRVMIGDATVLLSVTDRISGDRVIEKELDAIEIMHMIREMIQPVINAITKEPRGCWIPGHGWQP